MTLPDDVRRWRKAGPEQPCSPTPSYARVDIQKMGGRLAFANCYIQVGEERIVRASAVFAFPGVRKARG